MIYTGPARFRLFGDRNAALAYVHVGRVFHGQLRNRLATNGVAHGSWRRVLPDGAEIRCIKDGELDVIEIVPPAPAVVPPIEQVPELYMETGYLDARSFGVFGAYQPKAELINTPGGTPAGTDARYFDTLLSPSALAFRSEDGKSHTAPGGLGDKRYLRLFQPTRATGKLRLWMQALLGRGTPSYSVPAQGEENEGEQSPINQETLSTALQVLNTTPYDSISDGSGLYSADDYQYFLIQLDAGQIRISRVELGASARALRTVMLTPEDYDLALSDEDLRKLEAYLLADASIGQGEYTQSMPSLDGEPLYYGWHFNRKGDKADIVTLSNYYQGEGPGAILKHLKAYHYRMTAAELPTYNPDVDISTANRPLNFTFDTVENATATPQQNSELVWKPDPESGLMIYHYWHGCLESYNDDIYGEAPLYCFYNAADELKVLRHKRQGLGNQNDPASIDDVYNYTYTCDHGEVERTYEGYDDHKRQGFLLGDEITATYDTGTGQYANAVVSAQADGTTATLDRSVFPQYAVVFVNNAVADCGYEWPLPWDGAGNTHHIENTWGMQVSSNRVQGTASGAGDAVAIIPYYDAESVYLGKYQSSQRQGNRVVATWYRTGGMDITFLDEDAHLGSWDYIQPARSSDYHPVTGFLSQEPDPPAVYTSESQYIGSWELTLVDRTSTRTANSGSYDFIDSADPPNDILTALGRWSALLDPVICGGLAYPFFDLPYSVVQSDIGECVYFTDPNASPYEAGIESTFLTESQEESIQFAGLFSGWA